MKYKPIDGVIECSNEYEIQSVLDFFEKADYCNDFLNDALGCMNRHSENICINFSLDISGNNNFVMLTRPELRYSEKSFYQSLNIKIYKYSDFVKMFHPLLRHSYYIIEPNNTSKNKYKIREVKYNKHNKTLFEFYPFFLVEMLANMELIKLNGNKNETQEKIKKN
ncbi:MAG: hypothetical protein M0P71_00980 [Melioribacteraceae bacterium]|nr:hypothetical protein [Melioribacteraceae bacterium]